MGKTALLTFTTMAWSTGALERHILTSSSDDLSIDRKSRPGHTEASHVTDNGKPFLDVYNTSE